MSRYVVTGGAGFIGSTLVRELLREPGAEVAVIDNYLTGKASNLDEVAGRFEMHVTDICDYAGIAPVLANADAIFHLAAIPSVPRSIHEPIPSHEVNINGTFNVLRAAAEGKAKRLVFAASSSAYGDTPTLPKVESMTPNPKSPYAAQKLMGEHYISVFQQCFGLDAVALRFFNVYGPRQDPSSPYSGVISIFLRCLVEGTSPTIYGDGEQTRDFTYVEDVARLCIKASRAGNVAGKVFNAGNGGRFSLNEVWRVLNAMEGSSIPAQYGPPREGDVRDSMACTRLATEFLSHAPEFTLEEGLRRTLAWYKSEHVPAS
jgi:UDP-glucose 4-epimerase